MDVWSCFLKVFKGWLQDALGEWFFTTPDLFQHGANEAMSILIWSIGKRLHCHCIFQDIWQLSRRINACTAFQNIKEDQVQTTMSVQGVQNCSRPTKWVSWGPIWKWDCLWVGACLREHRNAKGGSAIPAQSPKISYQNWQTKTIFWIFARGSFRNIFCRFLGLQYLGYFQTLLAHLFDCGVRRLPRALSWILLHVSLGLGIGPSSSLDSKFKTTEINEF